MFEIKVADANEAHVLSHAKYRYAQKLNSDVSFQCRPPLVHPVANFIKIRSVVSEMKST
jgi:hypothetical protein